MGCSVRRALEGVLNVLGGDGLAVMELGVAAQVEGVGLAVLADVPALRQVGRDLQPRVERHETAEHLDDDACRGGVARLVRVQGGRLPAQGVEDPAPPVSGCPPSVQVVADCAGGGRGSSSPPHASVRVRGPGRKQSVLLRPTPIHRPVNTNFCLKETASRAGVPNVRISSARSRPYSSPRDCLRGPGLEAAAVVLDHAVRVQHVAADLVSPARRDCRPLAGPAPRRAASPRAR